jgi:hypothetical protein
VRCAPTKIGFTVGGCLGKPSPGNHLEPEFLEAATFCFP